LPINPNRFNMLREIKEQPQTLQDTVSSTLRQAESIKQLIEETSSGHGAIFLIGCGTSYYASIAGKYAIQAFSGIPCAASVASEFRDFEIMNKGDTVIAVSQSGETGDVLTAVKQALKHGCRTITITNEAKSTLAEMTQETIVTKAGKESAVPMTKTYTALLVALFSIAVSLGDRKQLISELKRTPRMVEETIKVSETMVKDLSYKLGSANEIFLLGRGPNYATVAEAALKLKEASLVHAEAFHSPEFRHGPKALVRQGTPVIALTTSNKLDETTVRLVEELKTTGANTISIGDLAGSTVRIPTINYYLTPITYIIPLQLLAFYLAVQKGIDPDNPRSLAKVTTTT
jgi:glucosamine--fructose-6-phosphate aminotransferase (isomerizing)